jgi:hypothetical protein
MPAVNNVGEPCAGEPHARFDGRGLETGHITCHRASPRPSMPRVLSVVAAAGRRLVVILSLGCDGGPSVVSGGRRFHVAGGRAVVVGTGGVNINQGRPELVAAERLR